MPLRGLFGAQMNYITVADVDSALGADWASEDKAKVKAVLMANAWLSAQNLHGIDPDNIPDDVKMAGAYVASVAAAGNLYVQRENSGVLASESVKAGNVEVSESYYTGGSMSSSSLRSILV